MIVLRLDKKALTSLIEGEGDEFKLELTRSVLCEASRAIVRNIIPREAEELVRAAAKQEIAKQIGEYDSWYNRKVKLTPTMQRRVDERVALLAERAIEKAYSNFSKTLENKIEAWTSVVEDEVDKRVQQILWREIERVVKERVAKELETAKIIGE